MTAELCDCYASKHEGVNAVLDAVESAAGAVPILVWQNDGSLVPVPAARRASSKTAAANWLALAAFAGRFAPHGPALLIDTGSTTTDLIPLRDGVPVPAGRTDPDRLAARELVYTGVLRTPICAVLPAVTWRGQTFRPAAEFFATTRDAYLLLGAVAEEPADRHTADGRPATRGHAKARLARMLCADADTLTDAEARDLALQVRHAQLTALDEALSALAPRLSGTPRTVILAGAGEFLARAAVAARGWQAGVISLCERLGPEVSRAACAYALAVLAVEMCP
jgi:probable H4MPT-linked C1 transfer pathway protein